MQAFFNPFNLCQCVLKPLFFCSSVEQTLKSCSAFTVALTGLNKSAARFDSERVSKIIPDSRLCWNHAAALHDTDIKGKSAFVTLLATSFPCVLRGYFSRVSQQNPGTLQRHLLSFALPQNQPEPLEGEIKGHEQSFISKVSSITFHWS